MNTKIYIENLKCHGCANTIRRNLLSNNGVKEVIINHEDSSVEIDYDGTEEQRYIFTAALSKLGYPEKGSNSGGATVKSYVSCMLGRIKKEKK